MTPKEYLKQAYRLNKRIDSMIQEVEELKSLASSAQSPQFGERVQTTRNNDAPFLKNLAKVWEQEEQINQQIDCLIELRCEMGGVIDSVENVDEQLVLRYRYLHGQTWEDIADTLCADRSTVLRWHSKALTNVIIPENATVV